MVAELVTDFAMGKAHPLAEFRKTHKPPLTQADLARLLGVKPPTVLRWENGERKIGGKLLPRVSEKTGIPKRDLRPDLARLVAE